MKGYTSVLKRLAVMLAVVSLGVVAFAATPAQALPGTVGDIRNAGNNKCLDVRTEDNYTVQIWNCTGHTEQHWIYGQPVVIGGISYISIINWRTSGCLQPAGKSLDAEVNVVVVGCDGSDAQYWEPLWNGASWTRLLQNKASGLCVDLRFNNPANGTIIWQYPCNGTDAQSWSVSPSWF